LSIAAAPDAMQSDATSLRCGSAAFPRRLLAIVADFRTEFFTMLRRPMPLYEISLTRAALRAQSRHMLE
jgi:hypothetical protein